VARAQAAKPRPDPEAKVPQAEVLRQNRPHLGVDRDLAGVRAEGNELSGITQEIFKVQKMKRAAFGVAHFRFKGLGLQDDQLTLAGL